MNSRTNILIIGHDTSRQGAHPGEIVLRHPQSPVTAPSRVGREQIASVRSTARTPERKQRFQAEHLHESEEVGNRLEAKFRY